VPKNQNLVDALICYKQKCKVVSLNLAHPVYCDRELIVCHNDELVTIS